MLGTCHLLRKLLNGGRHEQLLLVALVPIAVIRVSIVYLASNVGGANDVDGLGGLKSGHDFFLSLYILRFWSGFASHARE